MSLQWRPDEIPHYCHLRCLESDPGYSRFNEYHLPIDERTNDIIGALGNAPIIGIQGGTGCGKTSRLPWILLNLTSRPSHETYPICIVQHSRFACQELHKSFIQAGCSWESVHIRTGEDANQFIAGQHTISIITYGIL